MLAEKNISCLSLIVALIISLIIVDLFLAKRLSASSITIVLIVCAVIFFFLIKSKTLPAEPTIICGFTSLSFFICFSIFDSPIIVNEVIFILEFFASNLICASICITNS